MLGVLVAIAVIAAAGTMFWFLVKAMARIQMPDTDAEATCGERGRG